MSCLILGAAACVWRDLSLDDHRAPRLHKYDEIIAVNDLIIDSPIPPTFGVSRDVSFLQSLKRMGLTMPLVGPEGVDVVGRRDIQGIDILYDQPAFSRGSSGLYAVGFALLRGHADIVLAGIPLDGSPHYNSKVLFDFTVFRDSWIKVLPLMKGKVRSMSGWTKDLLC